MPEIPNYVPNIVAPTPNTSGDRAGSGDPEGVRYGGPGDTYINTDDDSFWGKESGYGTTGWVELTGSGGGTTETFTGAGTPEGSKTASPGNVYFDTTNNAFYAKKTGTGNTGWYIIAG